MQMSNHGFFECGDLSPLWPRRQKESGDRVAALHVGRVICPCLARIRGRNRVNF